MPCRCGSGSTIRDDYSGSLICASCGLVLEFDNYDAQINGRDGPTGTFIAVGHSGIGFDYSYRERKIFEAKRLIQENTLGLGIPNAESEVTSMIDRITCGEFGTGDWFVVLIGACSYVIMRRDNKILPASEIAEGIGCDVYELGRMISRVVRFLNLNLPEMSIASMFERQVINSSILGQVDDAKKEKMKKQGIFLVNCAVKWFLTTGRRPLPLVAAVMVFVAELNGVKGVKIGDVAKEVHSKVSTCRLRYKELLETLVKVAQALPWGKDVTVKNVTKHAPSVIQYMEMKSMEKLEGEMTVFGNGEFDLDDVVSDCLRTDVDYENYENYRDGNARCSDVGGRNDEQRFVLPEADKLRLSHESLSYIYKKFLNEVDAGQLVPNYGILNGMEGNTAFEFDVYSDWWNGTSEFSKKLVCQQILEKNVGYDPMPPSFIAGCLALDRRRKKISGAKLRISKIMHPSNTNMNEISEEELPGKKRKRGNPGIDWEDFIIETLLLHQVEEREIEKGNYNRLLDLHVFNSGTM